MEREQHSKPERARFPWVTCIAVIAALWIVTDVIGVVMGLIRHAVVLALVLATVIVIARIARARNH